MYSANVENIEMRTSVLYDEYKDQKIRLDAESDVRKEATRAEAASRQAREALVSDKEHELREKYSDARKRRLEDENDEKISTKKQVCAQEPSNKTRLGQTKLDMVAQESYVFKTCAEN